jgi:hypothetical protein
MSYDGLDCDTSGMILFLTGGVSFSSMELGRRLGYAAFFAFSTPIGYTPVPLIQMSQWIRI